MKSKKNSDFKIPKGFPSLTSEFHFSFQAPGKKSESSACFHYLGVFPRKYWNASLKQLGISKTLFGSLESKDLESQCAMQIKKLGKNASKKENESKTLSYELCLSSGAKLTFIFADPILSTFQLHTDLRKNAAEFFDSSTESELIIDIAHLSKTLQETTLEALAFISQASSWEPYRFTAKNSETKEGDQKSAKTILVTSSLKPKQIVETTQQAQRLACANSLVRSLGDLPCNVLHPLAYRNYIEAFAKAHDLEFDFLDLKELTRLKAEAFLAVVRSNPNSACGIAILKYKPKKAGKSRKNLALIGKGLTFDTGGYNIKTGSHMLGMHADMLGSAAVLALTGLLAQEAFPHEVTTYMAIAENLISHEAYKPNEVVTALDGTTIEVIDTDAEGRMVLSDTLALARQGKPDLALDFATLTGAVIRAIDTRRSGVYTHTPKLAALALRAGDTSGERVWNFPVGEDYLTEGLQSKIADLLQCSSSTNADHIYAATFLSHFIGIETPWIHMDLAAAHHEGGLGLIGSNTTGFGVRWARELIRLVLNS